MKKNVYVFDVEADNLLEQITKLHCLCYTHVSELNVEASIGYDEIRSFFLQDDLTLIGHKIVTYDIPAVEKVLGIKIKAKLIDTLGISYYLNSSNGREKHGLESYGEEFGILKPKVDDWQNLTIEEYVYRCGEDVKINYQLFKEQQSYLRELYDGNNEDILRLLEYITFKFDCLREQDENRIPVDVDLVCSELIKLEEIVQEKRTALLASMPEVVKYKTVSRPAKMEKADGSLSVAGEKWLDLLGTNGYEHTSTVQSFEVIDYKEPANPDSTSQLKDWLFSLGWVPQHIKFVRNKKTNEVKQVPQIKSEYEDGEVCQSVLDLVEQVPELEHLAGYTTVKHRVTILKGFIRDMDKDFKLCGDAMGFTNTFRLKHRILVNLPKPSALYADSIRACLIAGEGNYMVGADLKGIEDNCKLHYIYPFDPEYVKTMQGDEWDAHTDIAVLAGLMSKEEEQLFKKLDAVKDKSTLTDAERKEHKRLKEVRGKGKTTNFSATYKVGAKTLSRNLKSDVKFAGKILDTYWERNKSLKQFENTCLTKTVRGQLWVQQPVSKFWYTLRAMKDIFSTVNQGTAVYVFDTWVKYVRKSGIKVHFQAHDEIVTIQPDTIPEENIKYLVQDAMLKTNSELKLNITIGCSLDFGTDYKSVH